MRTRNTQDTGLCACTHARTLSLVANEVKLWKYTQLHTNRPAVSDLEHATTPPRELVSARGGGGGGGGEGLEKCECESRTCPQGCVLRAASEPRPQGSASFARTDRRGALVRWVLFVAWPLVHQGLETMPTTPQSSKAGTERGRETREREQATEGPYPQPTGPPTSFTPCCSKLNSSR